MKILKTVNGLILSAAAVLAVAAVVSADEFGAKVDLNQIKKESAAGPDVPGAPVKTPPADGAAAMKSAGEVMEASLSGKSDATPGGSFFKRQCGWMESDEKVRCMEHALALDLRDAPKGSSYYEEDPANKPFLRLTAEGKKFVLAGASDSAGTSGRKEPAQSAQDATAACLSEIGGRDGAQKRIMAERTLSVMRRSFEQKNADALRAMKGWGCGTDSADDIDRCWQKKNCPDSQR